MPSDLSSYLATHYLTADSGKPTKKRKRKHDKSSGGSGGGLLIQDDDDWGSGSGRKSSKNRLNDDGEDDDLPVTVGQVKDIRKTTKANWKTVGGDAPKRDTNDESAAADAILASAVAEHAAARAAADDDPTVVEGTGADASSAQMADGSHAGLQSAAAVTAQLARRQREEREQFEAERRTGLVQHGDEVETHYRDATGRRVDASMQRAAARRAAAEAEDKERAEKEALRGDVQVTEARRRREELDAARGLGVARTADDEDMNRELKEQRRWNDPMARFLDVEGAGAEAGPGASGAAGGGGKTGKKASRRPMCKHSAPPNRYGIRPGYRWDGVDRSNGFEAERFKALNRRERNKGLDYAWQMDE